MKTIQKKNALALVAEALKTVAIEEPPVGFQVVEIDNFSPIAMSNPYMASGKSWRKKVIPYWIRGKKLIQKRVAIGNARVMLWYLP